MMRERPGSEGAKKKTPRLCEGFSESFVGKALLHHDHFLGLDKGAGFHLVEIDTG